MARTLPVVPVITPPVRLLSLSDGSQVGLEQTTVKVIESQGIAWIILRIPALAIDDVLGDLGGHTLEISVEGRKHPHPPGRIGIVERRKDLGGSRTGLESHFHSFSDLLLEIMRLRSKASSSFDHLREELGAILRG